MEKIWERGNWYYKKNKCINGGKLSFVLIYQFLAIVIRITAVAGKERLKKAVKESLQYFQAKYSKRSGHRGQDIIEYLISHFLVTSKDFPDVSLNFQSEVRTLGQWLTGDEKLQYYTGPSGDVRLVPSKPARIGLWFYELAGTLSNSSTYILHIKMAEPWKQLGSHLLELSLFSTIILRHLIRVISTIEICTISFGIVNVVDIN